MDTTQIIIAIFGSNALFAFIQFLISRHDKRKAAENIAEKEQSNMILGLGHDRILYLTDKYVRRGAITLKEKRNLEYLYRPYKAMHGNGDCEIGYNACAELQVISDNDAVRLDKQI